jgi:hypothetical protein
MTKPRTIEELQEWVFEHANDGLIDGSAPFESGTIEYRGGMVPGRLYDQALLLGASLSMNKSQIVTHAFLLFISCPTFNLITVGHLESTTPDATTEFRGYVPSELYKIIENFQQLSGFTNKQVMTLSLEIFTQNCELCRTYEVQILGVEMDSGLTKPEIESKIFDGWRLAARQKRLKQSLDAGVLISDRKLS